MISRSKLNLGVRFGNKIRRLREQRGWSLKNGQCLRECRAGHEDYANPMVDQTIGNRNGSAVFFRVELFNVDFGPDGVPRTFRAGKYREGDR